LTGGRIPAFQVAGKLHNARQKIFCSNECPAAVFSRDCTAEAIEDRGYAWVVDGGIAEPPWISDGITRDQFDSRHLYCEATRIMCMRAVVIRCCVNKHVFIDSMECFVDLVEDVAHQRE